MVGQVEMRLYDQKFELAIEIRPMNLMCLYFVNEALDC